MLPELRDGHAPEVQSAPDDGGDDLPPTSLQGVSEDSDFDSDVVDDGLTDRGGYGAGDPAWAFFRADAERRGRTDPRYAGPTGFALYLREAGIVSPKRMRTASEHEVTGTDLEREGN